MFKHIVVAVASIAAGLTVSNLIPGLNLGEIAQQVRLTVLYYTQMLVNDQVITSATNNNPFSN